MATFQLQDKTAITGANLAAGDIFLTVDDPGGSPVVKKITAAELINYIELQALATTDTLSTTKDIGGSENLVIQSNDNFAGAGAKVINLLKGTVAGVGTLLLLGDQTNIGGNPNQINLGYTGDATNYDQLKIIPDQVTLQVQDGTDLRQLVLTNSTVDSKGIIVVNARLQNAEGTTIASANDITCPDDGNFFEVSGTTEIQRIAQADWQSGARITLKFLSGPIQITDGTAAGGGFGSILTATDANISASAGDVFDFVFDGTDWFMPRVS